MKYNILVRDQKAFAIYQLKNLKSGSKADKIRLYLRSRHIDNKIKAKELI